MTSTDDQEVKAAMLGLRSHQPTTASDVVPDTPTPTITIPASGGAALQDAPKPKRNKPAKKAKTEQEVYPAIIGTPPGAGTYSIYNTIDQTMEADIEAPIDNKVELTEQELKFIQLHVIQNVQAKSALVAAGYKEYSDQYAYIVARKIVKKYERWGEGAEIFSDLNFGPLEIARGIVNMAINCPNAQVRLNALALCAKATGMLKDQIEQQPGVTIIIKGRDDAATADMRPPAISHAEAHKQPAPDVRATGPIAITS